MRYVPHEYQEYAKEFIIRQKVGALFLDCGLGKTVITLTALWELLFDYFDIRKVLVIAPLRVARDTWGGEPEKWEHLSGIGISKVLGPEKERLAALEKKAQVYVINRENAEWLVDSCKWDFDMVVIDELSSFKSHKAKRFKALKKVRLKVKHIVGLTGTPAPNGLIDLWAEIGILDTGLRLGRFIGGYRERFFLPDKRGRQMVFSYKPREGAEETIYGLIADICISMRASDYLGISRPGMRSRQRWLMRLPCRCQRAGSFWHRWRRYGKSSGISGRRQYGRIWMVLCRGRQGKVLEKLWTQQCRKILKRLYADQHMKILEILGGSKIQQGRLMGIAGAEPDDFDFLN